MSDRVIAAIAALEVDDEPDPRWELTREEGEELERILAAGPPQWVLDIRKRIERDQAV